MIVERWIVTAKGGRVRELTDLVLSELVAQGERGNYSRPFRAYTPQYSGQPMNMAVFEWEYEDLAERDRVWAEWMSLPTTAAFGEKWEELTEHGHVREVWNVRTP